MKKFTLLFFALSLFSSLFAQNSPPYFPQEQLVYSDCEKANASECLYEEVGSQVEDIVSKAIAQYNVSKDTLKVKISFSVDKKGRINEGNYATINDSLLSKKIKKSLASIINEFEPFEVVNKKPKEYTSLHRLKYLYRVVKKDGTFEGLQTITPQEDLYKGGEIEEVPIYANCNVKTDKKARECFQKSIFNHIRDNFRYPEKAQKQGIQGKVYIIFTIDKEGKVTNIRTRGPHPILEEEAQRIISLIPQMTTPARLNGKPVKIPFSIPITFKLP